MDGLIDEMDMETLPPLGKYLVRRISLANDKISQAEDNLVKSSLIPRGGYTNADFKEFVVENSKVLAKMPRYLKAEASLADALKIFLVPKGLFLFLICRALNAFAADYSSSEVPEEFIEAIAAYYRLTRLDKAKWLSLVNDTEWAALVPAGEDLQAYMEGGNQKSREVLKYAKTKKPDLDLKTLMSKIRQLSDRDIIAFESKLEADLLGRFEIEDMLKLFLGYYSNSRVEYQKKLEQLSESFGQNDIETLQRMGDEALLKSREYGKEVKEQLIESLEKVKSGFPAIFKKSDVATIGGVLQKITSDMGLSLGKDWLLYSCRFYRLALQQLKRLLESYTEKTENEDIDRRDFLDKNKSTIKGQVQLVEYGLEKFHEAIGSLDKLMNEAEASEADEEFKELEEFKKIYNELVGRKRPRDDRRRLRGFLLTNGRFKGLSMNYNLFDHFEEFFEIKMPAYDYFKNDQGEFY